jgi:hypothetical protein
MGWHSFTVAPAVGDTIASRLLGRANNPATWSFESLGALVFRERRDDADRFYFCPKASTVFEPVLATNDGMPCDSPLVRTLLQARASRLVLGFRTDWEPLKPRPRKPHSHGELRRRR